MTKPEIEAVLSEALASIADDENVTVLAIFLKHEAGARIFTDLDADLVPGVLAELANSMDERGTQQMH